MRTRLGFALVAVCLLLAPIGGRPETIRPEFGSLRFEANLGQWSDEVLFVGRAAGYDAVFRRASVSFHERGSNATTTMRLVGAAPSVVEGRDDLDCYSNFFLAGRTVARVPNYARVLYRNAYPGIDIAFYDANGTLEWDVIAASGASVADVSVDLEHGLTARLERGTLQHLRPVLVGSPLAVDYEHRSDGTLGFVTEAQPPVVIDPLVEYSSYLPLTNPGAVTASTNGRVVVVGSAANDFAATAGAYDENAAGGSSDTAIMQLDPDGLVEWASYLGGTAADFPEAADTMSSGDVFVTGTTTSADFPRTVGPLHQGMDDTYTARLSAAGDVLVYAVLIGGTGPDYTRDVVANASGQTYVVGMTGSDNFPVDIDAHDTTFSNSFEGFVTAYSPAGTRIFATYLGGSLLDEPYAVEFFGVNPVVTGRTDSMDFPTTPGALAETDATPESFVTILSNDGKQLVASTYVDFVGEDVVSDSAESVWIGGRSVNGALPATANALQANQLGPRDGVIVELAADLSAYRYATYLGGTEFDDITDIHLTDDGVAAVGITLSDDFPATEVPFGNGTPQLFMAWIHPEVRVLRRAVVIHGGNFTTRVTIASNGSLWMLAESFGTPFPTTPDAEFDAGTDNAAVVVRGSLPPPIPTLSITSNTNEISSGQTLVANVVFDTALDEDVQLQLTSSDISLVFVAPQVTIPSGNTSAVFDVQGVGPGQAEVTARMPDLLGAQTATASFTINEGQPPSGGGGCTCQLGTNRKAPSSLLYLLFAVTFVAVWTTRRWGERPPLGDTN